MLHSYRIRIDPFRDLKTMSGDSWNLWRQIPVSRRAHDRDPPGGEMGVMGEGRGDKPEEGGGRSGGGGGGVLHDSRCLLVCI